jgi:hypothetical protein
MNKIIKDLGLNETFTKSVKRDKVFTKVKDNIPLVAHYNYMMDLLFLPTDKSGFKYCLVVVDLATNEFDIEPIKNKEPGTILQAFKSMYKRNYIKKPYASIRTDAGNEFKGVFQKYLYDQSILHKVAKAGRHKQLANVESLNKQLGRLFNGYLNKIEEETGKVYRNWTDIVAPIRTKLNAYRKITYKTAPQDQNYPIPDLSKKSQYKVGDIVYVKLDQPRNALGEKVSGDSFRVGDYRFDLTPRRILQVLVYSGKVPYRYIVTGIPNVSYTESELRPAKEKQEEYKVKEIIDKKKIKNKIFYLVWWQGYLKKDATWTPKSTLIQDVPHLVTKFEKSSQNQNHQ